MAFVELDVATAWVAATEIASCEVAVRQLDLDGLLDSLHHPGYLSHARPMNALSKPMWERARMDSRISAFLTTVMQLA